MFWLADLVLAIHFALAAFVTLGLLLIPVGAICSWQWVRNRIFRTVHAGLMVFVAAEAVIGMTCPLTTIEAYLRGTAAKESLWLIISAVCCTGTYQSVSFCGYMWRALSG